MSNVVDDKKPKTKIAVAASSISLVITITIFLSIPTCLLQYDIMSSFYIVCPSNSYATGENVKSLADQVWQQKFKVQDLEHKIIFLEQTKDDVVTEMRSVIKKGHSWQTKAVKLGNEIGADMNAPEEKKKKYEQFVKNYKNAAKDGNAKKEEAIVLYAEMGKVNQRLEGEKADLADKKTRLDIASEAQKLNKTSQFRVQLPHTIQLQGDGWRVGLAQFTYPRSWNNINEEQSYDGPRLHLRQNELEVVVKEGELRYSIILKVTPGYYESAEKLVEALNQLIEAYEPPTGNEYYANYSTIVKDSLKDYIFFAYDPLMRRVSFMNSDKRVHQVKLSDHLMYMLGFDSRIDQGPFELGETRAHFPPDMRAGVDSIFIYCDILEPGIIGDVRAPLLRTVGVSGVAGDVVDEIFDSPHYVPLSQRNFSSIHFTINSDQNLPIPFNFGKVLLKLHFVQVKQ